MNEPTPSIRESLIKALQVFVGDETNEAEALTDVALVVLYDELPKLIPRATLQDPDHVTAVVMRVLNYG